MRGIPSPEPSGFQKILAALAFFALLIIATCIVQVGWRFGLTTIRPTPVSVRQSLTRSSTPPPRVSPTTYPTVSPRTGHPQKLHDDVVPDVLAPPQIELQPGTLPWETRVESVLGTHLAESDKAVRLLQLLPSLPPDAFSRVTEEAISRLPDRDYSAVLPLLLNPETHGAVQAVLYDDLMERPDAIALPALLSLARISRHPFAPTARETLAALTGADFGMDWPRWETAVARLLSEKEGK